jgi:hypothetical protein
MTVVQFDPIVTYVNEAANYTDSDHPNLIGTLHDIECPSGRGWVVSLMGPSYFGNPNTQASAHLMVDAADVGQGGTLTKQLWHVGGPGNQLSVGMEQAGYASFTQAMWLGQEQVGATYQTPNGTANAWTAQDNLDMASQLELVARTMARLKAVHGIDLHWLTAAEHAQAVADYNAGTSASITGWVRHRDWTDRGLSNTTHHDTGDNYPTDLVMAKAIAYAGGAAPAPTPTPAPTTPGVPDMTPEQYAAILAAIAAVQANDQAQIRAEVGAARTALMQDNRGQIANLAAALNRFAATIEATLATKK